jgi:Tfp pilus assembly protein PilF
LHAGYEFIFSREKSLLFLKKKKQKDFYHLVPIPAALGIIVDEELGLSRHPVPMDRLARLHQGAAELARGNLAEAEITYRGLLAETPTDAEVLSNLGAVYNTAQCHEAAEAACRAALAALPGYWAALANLGTALHRQQRFEEATTTYLAAVRANPRNASAWTNLGVALTEQGRPAEALPMHDAAVALAPDDAELRTNRAMALLSAGDYPRGFAEFEWRWRTPAMAAHRLDGPLWNGEPADPGARTILLHEEGGFGDTLQFVRFVPAVVARGFHVVLRVQPELTGLVRRSLPDGVEVISGEDRLPDYDVHSPLLSLPRCFRTNLASVPSQVPYLRPCADRVLRWRARLRSALAPTCLRVGLVWAGAPRLGMAQMRAMNHRRSIAAARLGKLAGLPGIGFVSLQHGRDDGDDSLPQGLTIFDPMGEVAGFDDTAAIIANLDLVVAVDTAVAHLAGALAKPVWLLSRYDACWRWVAGRPDSPWYPSLQVCRQPHAGEWDAVLAGVAQGLAVLGARGRAGLP